MQKQEDEKLERRLHQVMEQIQPDEDAKDRMYLEIMRRALLLKHRRQNRSRGISGGRPVPEPVPQHCSVSLWWRRQCTGECRRAAPVNWILFLPQ